jgi:hypothetical protein
MSAEWRTDPSGRGLYRWWDGQEWTRFTAGYLPAGPPAEFDDRDHKPWFEPVDFHVTADWVPITLLPTDRPRPEPAPVPAMEEHPRRSFVRRHHGGGLQPPQPAIRV